jgi:hypothetical protein
MVAFNWEGSFCFFFSFSFCIPSICLFAEQFGRMPIELVAEYGTWEDVELLFPVTSKITTVADWSVHGIISHVHMEVMQFEVCPFNSIVHSRTFSVKLEKYHASSTLLVQNHSLFNVGDKV